MSARGAYKGIWQDRTSALSAPPVHQTPVADLRTTGGTLPRRVRILLAEDHDDTREALRMLLELQGYEVFAASDGEEALEVALAKEPDLILSDFNMPGLDGVELVRRLRALPARISKTPIVILSALCQTIAKKALEAGADAYITKPIDLEALEETLAPYLKN